MTQTDLDFSRARFEGPPDNAVDFERLCGQMKDVYRIMSCHGWMTLREIEIYTGHPQASISAQLRHLRKHRFGAHQIDKRRRNDGNQWEYSLKGNHHV